jgi:hypothetical protein
LITAVLAWGTATTSVLAAGADIAVKGAWSLAITADDLVGGPGSDLRSTYESLPGQVLLGVSNTAGIASKWRVDVRRANFNWPNGVRLFIRVSDPGTGAGLVDADGAYREVEAAEHAIISGTGDRSATAIQFRLTGMSSKVAANVYSTSVIFAVVDVP